MKNEVKQYQSIGGKAIAVNPYDADSYDALDRITAEAFEEYRLNPANQYATDAPDGIYDTDRFEEPVWQSRNVKDSEDWFPVHLPLYIKSNPDLYRQFLRLKQNQQVKETKEAETVEQAAMSYYMAMDEGFSDEEEAYFKGVKIGSKLATDYVKSSQPTPDAIAILEKRIAELEKMPYWRYETNIAITELKNILKELKG